MTSITRTGTAGSLSASYAYDAADRVTTVTFGNGTVTRYEYDDAGRVTLIRHEKADQSTLLQMGYTYTPDGLIATVTEIDDALRTTLTTYGYDNRNRLVSEQRAQDPQTRLGPLSEKMPQAIAIALGTDTRGTRLLM